MYKFYIFVYNIFVCNIIIKKGEPIIMNKIDPINSTTPLKNCKEKRKSFQDSLKRQQYSKKQPRQKFDELLKTKMREYDDRSDNER